MPSHRFLSILATFLCLALSAEIPAEQAVGIYEQTNPAHRELSPLWGMVSLKSDLLQNLRLFGAYGPEPRAGLPRHPGLSGANDHPQDAVAGVIQYLFPSPDGVNFVPNQRTKDPIGALSREREVGLPRILALLDAITFRKGAMEDAHGASSSRTGNAAEEAERNLRSDVIRILGNGSTAPDSRYNRILGPFAAMLAQAVRQEAADGGRLYPPRVVELALLGYAWTVADHVDELYRAFSPDLLLGPPPGKRRSSFDGRLEVRKAGAGGPVPPDEMAVLLDAQRTNGLLPELVSYGMARQGGARYPDCGETTLRNFFNIAFTQDGCFSEGRFAAFLRRFPAPPAGKLMELQGFYHRFPRIADQTTQAARDAWSAIVSGLNTAGDPLRITYRNGNHNLQGTGLRNMLNLIAHLLPDPALNAPWHGGQEEAAQKLDRLCKLTSTKGRTLAWRVGRPAWAGTDFGTFDFTINQQLAFAWGFRPGHFAMQSLVNEGLGDDLRSLDIPGEFPLLSAWRDGIEGEAKFREPWALFAMNLKAPETALNAINAILAARSEARMPTVSLLVEKVLPVDVDAYECLVHLLFTNPDPGLAPRWYPIPHVRALPQQQKAALFQACDFSSGNSDIEYWVTFWLQHGLDGSTPFHDGGSILAWTALCGSIPLTLEALAAGARVNDLDSQGLTPLLVAIQEWRGFDFIPRNGYGIVKTLLDAGADPLLADGRGDFPMSLVQSTGLAGLAALFERSLMEKAERKEAPL